MLETQVRCPNICFEVWTIYLEHYYYVLALASTQNPKWPLFVVQDGVQNGRHFRIFDHNFLTIHTRNTSKVSKHMFWGVRNLPETLWRCFWLLQVPKIQDGSQNGGRFYILIIISEPHMVETQVRYPNICFEVWTIYLKHYYNILALSNTQNPKWSLFRVQNGNRFRILIIIYILTIHTRNTSKVSKHYSLSMGTLLEALLRCFNYCRYPNPRWQPKWPLHILIIIS